MSELSDGMSFSQEIKIEALRRGTLIEVPVRYGTFYKIKYHVMEYLGEQI